MIRGWGLKKKSKQTNKQKNQVWLGVEACSQEGSTQKLVNGGEKQKAVSWSTLQTSESEDVGSKSQADLGLKSTSNTHMLYDLRQVA